MEWSLYGIFEVNMHYPKYDATVIIFVGDQMFIDCAFPRECFE